MSKLKTYLPLLLIILLFPNCGINQQTKGDQEKINYEQYLKITDSIDFDLPTFRKLRISSRESLVDKIQPAKNYKYWEYIFKDNLSTPDYRGIIMVYNGDRLNYAKIIREVNSNQGFFVECHPAMCFSYIIGVNENAQITTIDSENKLVKFIGRIDNIEEAILISKINGYWYDCDTIIGGAFKERENDYLLYLMEYDSWPVTYKSVRAILSKEGVFKVLDKTIYKKTEDYIIE